LKVLLQQIARLKLQDWLHTPLNLKRDNGNIDPNETKSMKSLGNVFRLFCRCALFWSVQNNSQMALGAWFLEECSLSGLPLSHTFVDTDLIVEAHAVASGRPSAIHFF
jgi:hypothetical protein